MISPSIGRVVWYWPADPENRDYPSDQPQAAIIVHVWTDRRVNLFIMPECRSGYNKQGVRLLQDGDERPQMGAFAEWMPYQKAVASGAIQPTLHAQPEKT